MKSVVYKNMGSIDYGKCWELQRDIFDTLVLRKSSKKEVVSEVVNIENKREIEVQAESVDGLQTLILCEHPHVYTLGKSGEQGNLLITEAFLKSIGATYYHIDRGGDITYHGPGQLVGYPILDLESLAMGLREYINSIEQAIINTVADFDVEAQRIEGAAGVWLKATKTASLRKICAIGVRSSHFVTMHGFALNVNTDLDYFSHINPCGFTDRGVSSLAKELGHEVEMEDVKSCFVSHFEKIINVKIK